MRTPVSSFLSFSSKHMISLHNLSKKEGQRNSSGLKTKKELVREAK